MQELDVDVRPCSPATSGANDSGGGGGVMDSMRSTVYNIKKAFATTLCNNTVEEGVDASVLGVAWRNSSSASVAAWVESQLKHIVLLTYRKNFAPLSNGQQSDVGWGCMLRTGQMVLCAALMSLLPEGRSHNTVLQLFMDLPSAPFSVHRISEAGAKVYIPVGEWFNPTATCLSLQAVVRDCPVDRLGVGPMEVIAARDAVERDVVRAALTAGRKVLLLIPRMLGISAVEDVYRDALLETFSFPSSVGIVGGKPNASLYFVGNQGTRLFYLDPHESQDAYVSEATLGKITESRLMVDVAAIDPCLLFAFAFASVDEFVAWDNAVNSVNPIGTPLIEIVNKLKAFDPDAADLITSFSSASD